MGVSGLSGMSGVVSLYMSGGCVRSVCHFLEFLGPQNLKKVWKYNIGVSWGVSMVVAGGCINYQHFKRCSKISIKSCCVSSGCVGGMYIFAKNHKFMNGTR